MKRKRKAVRMYFWRYVDPNWPKEICVAAYIRPRRKGDSHLKYRVRGKHIAEWLGLRPGECCRGRSRNGTGKEW